jgi:flavorubredoxin
MATVDEIADGIFRVNLVVPERAVTYSVFVVRADEPLLFETSFGQVFDEVRDAVAKVVDPTSIRHVVVPHVEGDECGAMSQFLALAPHAELLATPKAENSIESFTNRKPVLAMDGAVIDLGGKRLRILHTPYVHQWESLLAFEETTGTLFSSDLFIHPGGGPAVSEEDRTDLMVDGYRKSGAMPSMPHIHAALDKLEPLHIQRIACHHGPTIAGAVIPKYFQALRERDVTSFGRD